MIDSNSFKELLSASPDALRIKLLGTLSEPISFRNSAKFPEEKGVYFIVKNVAEDYPIYIGSANTGRRTVKIRCGQYLQLGSGGESVRGRLAKLLRISEEEAIRYIRDELSIRHITMGDSPKRLIVQLEYAAIWACQPVLNHIQGSFVYGELQRYIR
jgi:hypothetical protein